MQKTSLDCYALFLSHCFASDDCILQKDMKDVVSVSTQQGLSEHRLYYFLAHIFLLPNAQCSNPVKTKADHREMEFSFRCKGKVHEIWSIMDTENMIFFASVPTWRCASGFGLIPLQVSLTRRLSSSSTHKDSCLVLFWGLEQKMKIGSVAFVTCHRKLSDL